jgi:hypothetical protein
MSFLNQLRSQANAVRSSRSEAEQSLEESTARTEAACRLALGYFQDLARELNVLEPAAPRLTLDGRTPWPEMKLVDFRVDARRKVLRGREVTDYLAMGWQILPRIGAPVGGVVTVNFPPDLQRVEARLGFGHVKHERREIRHPEKNTLQAIRFEYTTQSRGSVLVTPDHDTAQLTVRLANTAGFEVIQVRRAATDFSHELLDELAKRIVSQPSRFA